MDINDVEITREMMEAVAIAYLYREDANSALRKVIAGKFKDNELKQLVFKIKKHPDFKEVQEETIRVESLSLTDDNLDTVMLQYNKLLEDAKFEKKYEVAARILSEIRKIKAIDNEQMKFEITIKVEHPEED